MYNRACPKQRLKAGQSIISIEGSRKICPLVLTCSIIRHSVPWVPEVIFLRTVYFILGILRTDLWSQGSHSGKFLVVVVQ